MIVDRQDEIKRTNEMVQQIGAKKTIYGIAGIIALAGVAFLANGQLRVSINHEKDYDWNLLVAGFTCIVLSAFICTVNLLNSCCNSRKICAIRLD